MGRMYAQPMPSSPSLSINGVAIVTGGGSGIGRECCLAYAAEGARGIVVADLDHEKALATMQESKTISSNPDFRVLALAVDVCDRASVDDMVRATVDVFGRIDYLVNSAGVGVQKHLPIEDVEMAEMNRFWQVNVLGTLNCIQAVTKVMKQQSVLQFSHRGKVREAGRGVILNVGSCNSYMATPHIAQYTTTKHAVIGLTKNAALDNAAYGIRVNAICPGWVNTPMVSAAIEGNSELPKLMETIVPMSRIANPEEIADVVMFMTSPRSSYVTGAGWLVDGGTTLQVQAC
ncbi:short-chain dehydrogenase/reductase SDR [Xylaria venustula]|nr:short-chain dehydrogenase/reductase SDR [Xylaria venustula]